MEVSGLVVGGLVLGSGGFWVGSVVFLGRFWVGSRWVGCGGL